MHFSYGFKRSPTAIRLYSYLLCNRQLIRSLRIGARFKPIIARIPSARCNPAAYATPVVLNHIGVVLFQFISSKYLSFWKI